MYANDNSKIFSAYANSLLMQISDPELIFAVRIKRYHQFSKNFIEPVSIQRIADINDTDGILRKSIAQTDLYCRQVSIDIKVLLFNTKLETELERRSNDQHSKKREVLGKKTFGANETKPLKSVQKSKYSQFARLQNFLLSVAFGMRKAVPIGFNRRSPFFLAYELSLVNRFAGTEHTLLQKLALFKQFAVNFKDPLSIEMMAQAIILDKDKDIFLNQADYYYKYTSRNIAVLQSIRRLTRELEVSFHYEVPPYDRAELRKQFPILSSAAKRQAKLAAERERRAKTTAKRRLKFQATAKRRSDKRVNIDRHYRDKRIAKNQREAKAAASRRTQLTTKNKRKAKDVISRRAQLTAKNQRHANLVTKRRYMQRKYNNWFSKTLLQIRKAKRKFSQPRIKKNKPFWFAKYLSNKAVLCLTQNQYDYLPLEQLDGYGQIEVLNSTQRTDEEIIDELQNVLSLGPEVNSYNPIKAISPQYSDQDKLVSDFCDRFANKLVEIATGTPSIRRFVPSTLDGELALEVSDAIYRAVQKHYSILKALEKTERNTPIFFSRSSPELPMALVRAGYENVFMLDNMAIPKTVIPTRYKIQSPGTKKLMKPIRTILKGLQKDIRAVFSLLDNTDLPSIIVATNTRSSSHMVATKLIADSLNTSATVTIADLSPNASPTNSVDENGPSNLYKVLKQPFSRQKKALSPFIQNTVYLALKGEKIGNIPAQDMHKNLSVVVERIFGSLVGDVILYRHMRAQLKPLKSAIILMVPGRLSSLRVLNPCIPLTRVSFS